MVGMCEGWRWWGCVRVEVHIHAHTCTYNTEMWLCEGVEVVVY